MDQLI